MRYALRTNDMNQVLDNFFNWDTFLQPTQRSLTAFQRAGAMDIWEDEKGFHMEVELPGLSEEDLCLELLNRTLTIEVNQKQETESSEETPNTGKYYLKERRNLSFTRRVPLPESADGDKMKAQFSNGLLTIEIPRKEEAQPKKITIN